MKQSCMSDVVISGAGMVGTALACALAPSGVKIQLLEQRAGSLQQWLDEVDTVLTPNRHDARVSALNLASVQLLTSLSAWAGVQSRRAAAYTDMEVWDGEGSGRIHFSADALHENCLGYIVENSVILAALHEQLSRYDNVELISGVSLRQLSAPDADGHRELLLSDGRRIEAGLLVGADGAESLTRRLAGIGATEWDYGHHAIVTTVRTEQPHADTCWQRFTEDGPLALLPLAAEDDRTLSIVWSTSPEHAASLMALDGSDFCAALGRAFEYRLGRIEGCDRRRSIALRQRHAHRYVEAGLALIGDAAHTIHPLAGQGVNLGFMDAAALAEVLLAAMVRGENWTDEAVLRRFQRQRRSANLTMAATMEGFRRLFAPQPPVVRLLRSCGMNLTDRLEPVKQHLVLQAMGLSGERPALARRPTI
ncbi:UbiH/UbiF/VisC/COQ6 family ubiquinone biosynthesis hydroxylase [Marinobacterium sp. MBR-109]|jgi:2-octaprenylphenol hydroxylase|uniref:UbiH/UbiF/VisC/COQ6 family ubiquinone biosynthesis hydroxylase n=1 Tax=Marinobacterium sp. MBR-109 TaxID=3156462 RepID=UPI00339AD642